MLYAHLDLNLILFRYILQKHNSAFYRTIWVEIDDFGLKAIFDYHPIIKKIVNKM